MMLNKLWITFSLANLFPSTRCAHPASELAYLRLARPSASSGHHARSGSLGFGQKINSL